ncbi:Peptidase A1 domain-containing protein [Aphelenchoides besseyi]|nr:Peptidase A1 domain-containing protein [Aphelenchoides besseyi]
MRFLVLVCFLLTVESLVLRGKRERKSPKEYKKFYALDYPQEPLIWEANIGTPLSSSTKQRPYRLSVEIARLDIWTLAPTYPSLTADNQIYDHSKSKTSYYYNPYSGELSVLGLHQSSLGSTGVFNLRGYYFADVFALNNETVFEQVIGNVQFADGNPDSWLNPEFEDIDGALGLGWDPAMYFADPDFKSNPILNILHYDKTVQGYFYIVWIGKQNDWQVSFGVMDDQHCESDYQMVNLDYAYEENVMAVYIDSFTFGDYSSNNAYAAVDTGSPIVYMPEEAYLEISINIGATYDYASGLYVVDCADAVNFDPWVFTINSIDYKIKSSSYIVDLGLGGGECVVAFGITDSTTISWILGYPWLTEYCTRVDVVGYGTIGFSKSKN